MRTIKKKNRKILVGYILVNVVLFSLFSNNFIISISHISNLLNNPIDPNLISALLLFALAIVFEGVLSSKLKAIIIFNRIKYPLPGCRAFTKIAFNDERINISKLREIYKEQLPFDPVSQNSEWYKIYQIHKDDEIIQDAHNAFLLTRDLLAFTIIFLVLSSVFHIILGTSFVNIIYNSLLYIILTILLKQSAYNYGNRFTADVLVAFVNSKL